MTTTSWDEELAADAAAAADAVFAGDGELGRPFSRAALEELGWDDLVAVSPSMAVALLAQAEGRVLAVTPIVDLAARLGLPDDLPGAGLLFPPGLVPPLSSTRRSAGWAATAGDEQGDVLVPVKTAQGTAFAVVPAERVERTGVGGIDPEGSLMPVSVPVPPCPERTGDWSAVLRWTDYYVANAVLGSVGAMIALARDHVSLRHQFGQPLGAFQAVQHRLADAHVTWEAARALVPRDDQPGAVEVAMLVLAAQEAFEVANRECTQVMGAIACTWEHPLHRYVRRCLALLALGSGPRFESAVAAAISRFSDLLGEVQ